MRALHETSTVESGEIERAADIHPPNRKIFGYQSVEKTVRPFFRTDFLIRKATLTLKQTKCQATSMGGLMLTELPNLFPNLFMKVTAFTEDSKAHHICPK